MLNTPLILFLCRTLQWIALLSISSLHPSFTYVSLSHPSAIKALLIFSKTSCPNLLISSDQFLVVFIFYPESLHRLAFPYFSLMLKMFDSLIPLLRRPLFVSVYQRIISLLVTLIGNQHCYTSYFSKSTYSTD